jgi:hypothetical protein
MIDGTMLTCDGCELSLKIKYQVKVIVESARARTEKNMAFPAERGVKQALPLGAHRWPKDPSVRKCELWERMERVTKTTAFRNETA